MCEIRMPRLVESFADEIRNSTATVFIGSGLAKNAGYADWRTLLRNLAEYVNLDVDRERDLITLAEYVYQHNKGRTKINKEISKLFAGTDVAPDENYKLLGSLPMGSYWTTNYDQLLERTLRSYGQNPTVVTDDESMKKCFVKRSAVVYKLHGDIDSPSKAVFTRSDYDTFDETHTILMGILKSEMCSKSFLFLGYSFTDPDVRHIFAQIRSFYRGDGPQTHYRVLRRVRRADFGSVDDYEYALRKQSFEADDLMGYGIHTVFVDDYAEITDMLREIRHRISSKDVFLSGAFDDATPEKGDAAKYARVVAQWLFEHDFRIHTGYGKNIGPEIVAGAFSAASGPNTTVSKFNDSVFVYPFPYQKDMPDAERKAVYTNLRSGIILKTNLAVVINGTKVDRDTKRLVNSDGCLEEAHLSMDNGNMVIPIAVTGGAARKLWDEIVGRVASGDCTAKEKEYYGSPEFKALKDGKSFEDVFSAVISLIMRSDQC